MAACKQPDGGDDSGGDENPSMTFADLHQETNRAHNDEYLKDWTWAHGGIFWDGWGFLLGDVSCFDSAFA